MKKKDKKIRLTPLQADVLRTLDEAGEEDICSLLNTLVSGYDATQVEVLVVQFLEAITGLMRIGSVSVTKYKYVGGRLVMGGHLEIGEIGQKAGESLEFDIQEGGWKWMAETRLNVELQRPPRPPPGSRSPPG